MSPPKILVVEDESIVALYIERTLKRMGYFVIAIAASGEEAINNSLRIRPDLVLMDIRLKGHMDGIEVAKIMRSRFGVPVVYLTAQADETTLKRAQMTNPYGFLTKPFEQHELQSTIEMALGHQQHD